MLTYDNSLTFAKGVEPDATLRNFWGPEDKFVWSTGKWCEIVFGFHAEGKAPGPLVDLILDMDVFKVPEKLLGQNLFVYLNGLRIASQFCQRRTTSVASIDPKLLRASENMLTIDTPDSAMPSDFGVADTRLLGIQLFSVQLRKII